MFDGGKREMFVVGELVKLRIHASNNADSPPLELSADDLLDFVEQ